MSNDDKSAINPTLPPPHLHPMPYRQQEAISLVALGQVLLKQKKIILFSMLITALLGIGFAAVKPVIYSFSTMVQIGTLSNDNKRELIETPDTVLNKLMSAYIPFVLAEFYNKAEYKDESFTVNASIPKKSDLLLLEAKGPISQEAAYKELISAIVNKLVEDHSKILSVKVKSIEGGIVHAENALASTKDNAKFLESNMKRLDETTQLLNGQLAEKKQLLANMLKNRSRVSSNSTEGAMNILLIDNEIQHYQQAIGHLEKQVLIDINQRHSEFEKALSDNLREQKDRQNNLDQLKNALANVSNTATIVPVLTSMKSVSIGKKTMICLAIVLGGILGVVLAFIYDFYQKKFPNLKVTQ